MDELLKVLEAESKRDGDSADFALDNSGIVIRIKTTTRAQFATASEALADAQRLVSLLLDTAPVYKLVNWADIGASVDNLDDIEESPQWRGRISICLDYNTPESTEITGALD